jgi:di/tricarboxylate transporter
MTLPQLYLIVIVAVPLVLVSLDYLRIDVAALLIAVSLGIAQYLGMAVLGAAHAPGDAIKAIIGFGEPAVLTLLSLFIITSGLEKSGITRWIARYLLKIGGQSERRLIGLFAGTTALLSLFMNNLAAGALVLPIAIEVTRRTRVKPSKLLIPVAYGSLLGGASMYFAATANIIVSNLLETAHPPQPPLGVLSFTPTGGLIAIAGIGFLTLFGRRWLPDREPSAEQMMARMTGSDLEDYYRLDERMWEARVLPDSPLTDKCLSESNIGRRFGLTVAGVLRGQQSTFAPPPNQTIQTDDILLVIGSKERVSELAETGLKIGRENSNGTMSERGVSLVEAMVSPRSQALGHTLRELEFRAEYHFTVLALYRGEQSHRTDVGNISLMMGDSLLLIGSRSNLPRLQNSPDFIVLEPDLSDQPVNRVQATVTLGIFAAAIIASILGLPVYLAMLAGAMVLMLTRVLDMEEAYRAIEWQAIMLIAGMYSVSVAMTNTGLAQMIGERMLSLVAPLGPVGLAGGAYILTTLLTQVMGGQISALVTGPISISAAISLGTNPQAIAVATAIGCSASFFTPIAHPVNLLMMAPANYRFGDFFRIGWRLTIVCFIALIVGVMLFWKL